MPLGRYWGGYPDVPAQKARETRAKREAYKIKRAELHELEKEIRRLDIISL
jgi:hypothetical protein